MIKRNQFILMASLLSMTFLSAEQKKVTIWIHGTRIAAFMPLAVLPPLSALEHTILYAPSGLHKPTEIDQSLYQSKLPSVVSSADPNRFPLEDFYVFGWSGDLDTRERIKAGKQLCDDLTKLVADYKQKYTDAPSITFITHSHGGNVVLEMVKVCSRETIGNQIEAIFLACPVQQDTENIIKNPIFKKIYNIHSHDDIVQVMDPQGLSSFSQGLSDAWKEKSFDPLTGTIKKSASNFWSKIKKFENPFSDTELFSGRHFKPQANLDQARIVWVGLAPWTDEDFAVLGKYRDEIKGLKDALQSILAIKNRGLVHMEFMFPLFLKRLPRTLNAIDTAWKTKNQKDSDPDVEIKLK